MIVRRDVLIDIINQKFRGRKTNMTIHRTKASTMLIRTVLSLVMPVGAIED